MTDGQKKVFVHHLYNFVKVWYQTLPIKIIARCHIRLFVEKNNFKGIKVKNILILEDSEERIDFFKEKFEKDNNLFIFSFVNDAIDCLKRNKIDILFLDHDLDHRVMVNSYEKNTGFSFTKYIVNNNLQFEHIYIHSMNPVGAKLMYEELEKTNNTIDLVPFYLLLEQA